jgi:hypothetical protein
MINRLNKIFKSLKQFIGAHRWLQNALLAIPIIIYTSPLLLSGNRIIPGDPDYMFQLFEAFRRSVLEFHQLPLWNAWVAGGVPLFANINFGLISIPAPLTLIFGAVIGLKLSVMFFLLIGFFGFKKLFQDCFKTNTWRSMLLSYIAVFCSFFAYRTVVGHFNFLLLVFFPWLVIFFIQRNKRFSWLWFALVYSFMVWSSPHNITIMSLFIIGLWYTYDLIFRLAKTHGNKAWNKIKKDIWNDILFFIKSGFLIILLTFYRLFFALSFIHDFPRLEAAKAEHFTGTYNALYAIWRPFQYSSPPTLRSGWGWAEASAYIGIGTLICALLIASVYLRNAFKKRKDNQLFSYPLGILIVLCSTLFILGLGNFGGLSPYVLLNKLPIFNSMRVATRWLVWCSVFTLIAIATYKGKKYQKIINALLVVTVIELFVTGFGFMNGAFFLQTDHYRLPKSSFNQENRYRIPRPAAAAYPGFETVYYYDENLLETTQNNLGEIIAGDSLVDTRQPNSTIRCGENQGGCNYLSGNARVVYWSPNKIILERLAPGPININMNPGRGWTVNNRYIFKGQKVTDPNKGFIFDDPAKAIVLEYAPALSPAWVMKKL